jgi:phage tail protein X
VPILSPTQYMTSQGDLWDEISKQVYGTELYMNILTDANPAYNGVAIFDDGIVLTTPIINTAKPVYGLPPWRQTVQIS